MRAPLPVIALSAAAAAVFLTLTGSAFAATTSIAGTTANGGCDAARTVSVSGPSRIEIEVSSTAASVEVFGQVLAPNGSVVAESAYDTPGAGNYAVRVCKRFELLDQPTIQYTALIATGPAGQRAMPVQEADRGGVLGVTGTIGSSVSGKGAIVTRSGLAWFTLRVTPAGVTNLTVFDPVHHTRTVMKGMSAVFGTNSVRIAGNGLALVLVRTGSSERISFNSARFEASGKVVRGHFQIVA